MLDKYYNVIIHHLVMKLRHGVMLIFMFLCMNLAYPANAAMMSYDLVFNVKSAEYRPYPFGFEFNSFTTPRYFSSFPAVGDTFTAVNFTVDTAIPSDADLINLDDESVLVELIPAVFRAEIGGIVWDIDDGESRFFGGSSPFTGNHPHFRIANNQVEEVRGIFYNLSNSIPFLDFSTGEFTVQSGNGKIKGDYTIIPTELASPDTILLLVTGFVLIYIVNYRRHKLTFTRV